MWPCRVPAFGGIRARRRTLPSLSHRTTTRRRRRRRPDCCRPGVSGRLTSLSRRARPSSRALVRRAIVVARLRAGAVVGALRSGTARCPRYLSGPPAHRRRKHRTRVDPGIAMGLGVFLGGYQRCQFAAPPAGDLTAAPPRLDVEPSATISQPNRWSSSSGATTERWRVAAKRRLTASRGCGPGTPSRPAGSGTLGLQVLGDVA
jgi:hypothetical protein